MYRVVVQTDAAEPGEPSEVRELVCHSRSVLDTFVKAAVSTAPVGRARSITITTTPRVPQFLGWGGRGPARQDDDFTCCSNYS